MARRRGRISPGEAAQILSGLTHPEGGKADFHSLRSDDVQYLLDAAKEIGYRAPKGASGSKARYFYAFLNTRKSMHVRRGADWSGPRIMRKNPRKRGEAKAEMRLLDPAGIGDFSLWLFFGDAQSNVTRHHQLRPQPLDVWREYLRKKMDATLRKRTAREYDVVLGAERTSYRRSQRRLRVTMRRNPRNETAVELAIFIENDGQIYRSQTLPIIKNLQRKIAKGTYNETLALKLWRHLADRGAKDYHRQHGSGGDWHAMFSTADRADAAALLADKYEEHVREPLPVAVRTRKKSFRRPSAKIIPFRRNPTVGSFYICGHARGRTWYYRHSTQAFSDSKTLATAYRSRAHAERVAKTLVNKLPRAIESISVKS